MAFLDTAPKLSDSDNNLLFKIAQILDSGGGAVAGVSSISLNGGAPQTGAVSIATGGTVTSVNGDPGPAVSLDSGEIPEGANLYFTNARGIASTLTGFVAAAGTVTAADSILTALQKSSFVTNDLLNFRDTSSHADASIYINSGATEIIKVIGSTTFLQLNSGRIQRNVTSAGLAILGGTAKGTGAYIELHGDTSAGNIGLAQIITKGQATGEGNFRIFNAALGSASADLRAEMTWEGNFAHTPTWNNVATTFTGFKLNATDTTSAAASLLADYQVGAASKWKLGKTGIVTQTGSLVITGGTITAVEPILDLTRTWNNGAVTFTAIKYNVTDTASAAASLIADMRVGGVSKWSVGKGGVTNQTGSLNIAGGTITAAEPLLNLTRTWNNGAVSFTSILANITNTASAATSLLMDLQVGGASKLTVLVNGNVGVGTAAPQSALEVYPYGSTNISGLRVGRQGVPGQYIALSNVSGLPTILANDDINGPSVAPQLVFARRGNDGVSNESVRIDMNGRVGIGITIPQEKLSVLTQLSVYDVLTDASNYSRILICPTSTCHFVQSQAIGTGVLRVLQVGTGPVAGSNIAGVNTIINGGQPTGSGVPGAILFQQGLPVGGSGAGVTALATIWQISTAGHLLAGTDSTYDIGASGATRPRHIYAAGSSAIGSAGFFFWASRSQLSSPSDGVIKLENSAATDFGRLQFGGTTTSFPAFKRSTTFLQFRLADDSGFTGFTAGIGANAVVEVNGTGLGFFAATPVVKQASAANLTNNVTSGGTDDTIANFTDLTIYANDAAAIRNDIYQLARKLKQVNDALRLYGLLT